MIEMTDREFVDISDAVRMASGFLRRRDQMNAILHCQEVRWSPLTEKVDQAALLLRDLLGNAGQPKEESIPEV